MESDERQIEELAAERARRQTQSARWNVNIVIFTYAILTTVMLLRFENIPTEVVASVAVSGLAMTWFLGRMRGKKLYQRLYERELAEIKEAYHQERAEAMIQSPLSTREGEILNYVANGQINKEIAFQLGISEQTIKNHITNILRKLDVSDRTQAAVLGMRNGWVSFNDTSNPSDAELVESLPRRQSRQLSPPKLVNAK